jgi:tetratricopeptide (TPR) repeat protein
MNMGKSDTWKQQGKYLFASGKYEEAIKCLNRVIQKEPEDVESWIFKGRSLYYQHKYLDAVRCYEKANEFAPEIEDGWKGIIQCCDKLIDLNTKGADAWDNKVNALINLNKYDEAVEICDKDLGFRLKNSPEVWNWKGDALRRINKYEDSIKYYNKTLKQDPENEDAWINSAKALFLLGRVAEAAKCCDKVVGLYPKNANAWAIKGVALKALHRYPESEAAFAKAKELGYREEKAYKKNVRV